VFGSDSLAPIFFFSVEALQKSVVAVPRPHPEINMPFSLRIWVLVPPPHVHDGPPAFEDFGTTLHPLI